MAYADGLVSLHQILESKRDVLEQLLLRTLRESLFSSRAFLRPTDLGDLVSSEADAFLAYFQSFNPEESDARGANLARIGLSDEALLRIGQALRHFCIFHMPDGLGAEVSDKVEEFLLGLVRGYVRTRETIILEEQEHIRSALQHSLHRYTLQLETTAEVARTAISTLKLGMLLTTAVDLIGERFGLDYVAIYLLDEDARNAELRAATGIEGRVRLSARHSLKANGASTVGKCLATRQYVLVMARGGETSTSSASWLADTQSEIVLPLITHDKVIGVLSVQSKHSGTFSSQDVVGFQIMCDQLANAIENARLYANSQQRAEDLAQAYEQLKELEELKDQFMQNVSHELRTPLTMIRGYAEFLLSGELGAVNVDQQEALQVIMRNSEALGELVADILSMLEVHTAKTPLTAFSMAEIVQDSVAGFQILAARNGVSLDANLSTVGPCLVMARADHLRRIADNLLSNAMKFTPAGGRVRVRLWEDDQRVYLETVDTGIGIPSHLHERVFERFFQVDSSRRRAYGGTGLGLALVKELVASYGGSVSAASPGRDQGSTFTVVLPCVVA